MAKQKAKIYRCTNCGAQEAKWSGQCPSCGEWNTLEEYVLPQLPRRGAATGFGQGSPGKASSGSEPRKLAEINIRDDVRLSAGIGEFDRVLGGGVIRGSSVLLGGEPGIGKSTLMLQAAAAYENSGNVLYISGEESAEQISLRARRLGIVGSQMLILQSNSAEQSSEKILAHRPVITIIDSIQTLYSEDSSSAPGSPNQIKFSVQGIIDAARAVGSACFFIAHVTKDGSIAGPKQVEHLVDAVLYFDHSEHDLRFLRASKNRFGSSDEVGLFSMDENGLSEVSDPSMLFISDDSGPVPAGTAIAPVYEGSRILMVEIQALTVPGKAGFSRIFSERIDQRRVSRVAAVLEKQIQIRLSDQDIYINVAGGIKVQDVGIELAIAMAMYSARTGRALPPGVAFCGELSLSGRVRQVSHQRRRVAQSAELGYSTMVIPAFAGDSRKTEAGSQPNDLKIVKQLSDAIDLFRGTKGE